MANEKQMITFVADQSWVAAVDDYRFEHRFPSRAATIKWLVGWALKQSPVPPKNKAEAE